LALHVAENTEMNIINLMLFRSDYTFNSELKIQSGLHQKNLTKLQEGLLVRKQQKIWFIPKKTLLYHRERI
jgi:hypothetical protein